MLKTGWMGDLKCAATQRLKEDCLEYEGGGTL